MRGSGDKLLYTFNGDVNDKIKATSSIILLCDPHSAGGISANIYIGYINGILSHYCILDEKIEWLSSIKIKSYIIDMMECNCNNKCRGVIFYMKNGIEVRYEKIDIDRDTAVAWPVLYRIMRPPQTQGV